MSTPMQPLPTPGTTWTAQTVGMSYDILDRMENAVAKVRERLLRATSALNQTGIPYAVVGGHAVASWMATVDEGAVRNTRDVDILVRRDDLPEVAAALETAGFVRDHVSEAVMFRDGHGSKPNEAVHLLFTGEKLRQDHLLPTPEINTVQDADNVPVITLKSLVLMKLMANRAIDHTHLRDLIGVRLIDRFWLANLPSELAARLQCILDNQDG